jgi:hypothetical protein
MKESNANMNSLTWSTFKPTKLLLRNTKLTTSSTWQAFSQALVKDSPNLHLMSTWLEPRMLLILRGTMDAKFSFLRPSECLVARTILKRIPPTMAFCSPKRFTELQRYSTSYWVSTTITSGVLTSDALDIQEWLAARNTHSTVQLTTQQVSKHCFW